MGCYKLSYYRFPSNEIVLKHEWLESDFEKNCVNSYRYAFNGMEKNEEWNEGSYDFGARIYDGRLGRWLATDPLSNKQPGWSPYKAFLDNPIIYVDPDGKTEFLRLTIVDKATGTTMVIFKMLDADKVHKSIATVSDGYGGTYEVERTYDIYQQYTIVIEADGTMSKSAAVTNYDLVDEDFTGPLWLASQLHDAAVATEEAFEGQGEVVKGGYVFTSANGGAAHTKTVASGTAEHRNIEDLLTALGATGKDGGKVTKSLAGLKLNDKKARNALDFANKLLYKPVKTAKDVKQLQKENSEPDSCTTCQKVGKKKDFDKDGFHGPIVPRKKN